MRPFALLIGALIPLATAAQAPSPAPAWAAALDSAVTAELARTRTPGAQIAIVVDGRIAYTRGYGVADMETGRPVTARTLFRVGSLTKVVTGTLAAQLASEGKIDLRAPIARYVTEIEGKRVGTVTTHQLLTHTAGWLDNAVAYGRMGEGALGEVMTVVTDTLFFTEPGRILSYSNPGYSMAGYVIERAGKGRYGSLVEEKVLRPLRMPRATFRPLVALTHDFSQGHAGQPANPGAVVRPFTENTAQWAAGFLLSSAAELANLTIALMDSGRFEGRQVLAAEAVTRVTTGYQPMPSDTAARYGYGLITTKSGNERIWRHTGGIDGFNSTLMMFPDRRFAVVLFDNRQDAPLMGINDLVARLAAGITPPSPPTPPVDRIATPAERAQFVGTFKMGFMTVQLLDDGGELKLREGMMGAAPVRLVGDYGIVVLTPIGRIPLAYTRGADGRIAYLHQGSRSLARQP